MTGLKEALSTLGIEERFHALLTSLSGGEKDYLVDIEPADLQGCADSEGTAITAPVARGLVRKLRQAPPAAGVPAVDAATAVSMQPGASAAAPPSMPAADATATGTCELSLLRGSGPEASLLRCAVKAKLHFDGRLRRKVLTAILDRSGSMTSHWPLLVDAVMRVVTDSLLQDPFVSVAIVAYDGVAAEVPLPSSAAELRTLLLERFAPSRGITCFRAAFELAEASVSAAVQRHMKAGAQCWDVDVATLLFTDGQDTSLPPRGCPSDASQAAARAAGDRFRTAVRGLGCAPFTCIAAFGEQHSPEMCQCLADRYTYINRSEVLSEWLASGLDEMLGSAGQCALSLLPPPGAALQEPLPAQLPLRPGGELEHIAWLRLDDQLFHGGALKVTLDVAGGQPLSAEADVSAARSFPADSFEEHLFKLDGAAMQLRSLAQQLRGQRPSHGELDRIRGQLVDVKAKVERTRQAATAPGSLLRGRAALRARAAELDTLRERLSYAVGHFDTRDVDKREMGAVAIDAVLRDAGQAKPPGEKAARLLELAEAMDALAPAEALAPHARRFMQDALSGRNAQELAQQGDALFFQLHSFELSADGAIVAASDSVSLVGHEAFLVLSSEGTQAVSREGHASFSHLGLPLYATPSHWQRVQLLLPEVLQRLSPSGGERLLLSLLGHAITQAHVVRGTLGAASRRDSAEALLHKARAVHAALAGKVLVELEAEAKRFVEQPRGGDLYAMSAAGLVLNGWSQAELSALAAAIAVEACRRRVTASLANAGEEQRLWLAWAVLGPAGGDSDECLGEAQPMWEPGHATACTLQGGGYNPLTAADELEALDGTGVAPRAVGASAVRAIVATSCKGSPSWRECAAVLRLLPAWGKLLEVEGGLEGLWRRLDAAVVGDGEEAWVCSAVNTLAEQPLPTAFRAAIPDVPAMMTAVARECLQDAPVDTSIRAAVAAATRDFVARRIALVRSHPIRGAVVPNVTRPSYARFREIWGSPAAPVDAALHAEARHEVHARWPALPLTEKEALSDKEYRARGGTFAFPGRLDTFVEGLHCRTRQLHEAWRREGSSTEGAQAREAAVREMLLRLRWEDSDARSRAKLSRIVGCIWDGLEGLPLEGEPPSSALWLEDEEDWIEVAVAS